MLLAICAKEDYGDWKEGECQQLWLPESGSFLMEAFPNIDQTSKIVKVDDPIAEAELRKRLADGEEDPFIMCPHHKKRKDGRVKPRAKKRLYWGNEKWTDKRNIVTRFFSWVGHKMIASNFRAKRRIGKCQNHCSQ